MQKTLLKRLTFPGKAHNVRPPYTKAEQLTGLLLSLHTRSLSQPKVGYLSTAMLVEGMLPGARILATAQETARTQETGKNSAARQNSTDWQRLRRL